MAKVAFYVACSILDFEFVKVRVGVAGGCCRVVKVFDSAGWEKIGVAFETRNP